MTREEWLDLHRTHSRPVFKELTDEFSEMCEREPDNIMMRLARRCGVPEGINPLDPRIIKLFQVGGSR